MSTTSAATTTAATTEPEVRVTRRRVVSSEWIKLRSLRSTFWAVLAVMVSLLGMGAFTAIGIVVQHSPPGSEAIAADPTGGALSGFALAQLAVIALGVLVVSGEYRTRTILPSVTAVPARLPLVWAKAAVAGAVTTALSAATLLATFFVARAVVAADGLTISLTSPGVARAVLGGALALGVTAVLATAFGWLLRSTAGAVSALVALLHLVPSIGTLLPETVAAAVLPYLPGNAGNAVLQITPANGGLGPWTGLAVYTAWAALGLGAAALVLIRRDA
ncbi:ABC transporter permease [Pseudonocardia broussonetiae]|uniref:ABC transporter permease n=1 Tax=Pseudonocardia broussonetiae TaxID=2736640 RepID=A0A6M6JNT6_9PSEU|nr:ABC transporter permease [Pseudonocardia broussonetiae]QJY49035.1 ABC transporter permease [Pseudonocardia broussonetiae]